MKFRCLPIFMLILLTLTDLSGQSLDQQVNLFTIPNMSASFIRMPSRETSQEIDAVYSNPAGLTSLEDGLHFQLNNQFQFIRKGLTTTYDAYNDESSYYDFSLNNYTFPTGFVAWKRQNIVFSAGLFAAMGGGGGAAFDNLPSAELGISDMHALLSNILKIYDDYYGFDPQYSESRYSYDFISKGLAFSPGFQLGCTYQINDQFSLAGGVRYVTFISNATGSASNIGIQQEATGFEGSPGDYLRYIRETEQEAIQGNDIQMGIIVIDGDELLLVLSELFDELVPETAIDIRQRGKGFTPIIGGQYNWKDRVYAAFKYEHRTKIALKTTVLNGEDGDGLYEDGRIVRSDLPGFFSLGVRYNVRDRLILAAGHRTIMYKRADWNGREDFIDRNFLEFTISGEYAVHPKISVSCGYTYSEAKVDDAYQNEVDYVLPGHTFALGAKWNVNEYIALEGGVLNTIYTAQAFEKNYEPFQGRLNLPAIFDQQVKNEADGRVMLVAIGASISMPGSND